MSLNTRLFLLLLALGLSAAPLTAQISYGFKTGLNFSRMDGPAETGPDGAALETMKNVTGFHIGAAFGYPITDHYGVRAELLYSKKGGKYAYEGPAYRFFTPATGSPILTTGTARYLLNITQSYIDIPVFGYARFGDFEVQAGPYVALNIQSAAEGSLRYTGAKTTVLGNAVADSEFNLDHNYRKDDIGEGDNTQVLKLTVDGKTIEMPKTLGAYYDFREDRGRLYNSIDYG
ncbi:MAG TPA: outer membrane beta-barrel protein, partial [Saprospiraceae bacterium]|nr:outer membrane beta-barrel protein [Saprospiraceae bacterium]